MPLLWTLTGPVLAGNLQSSIEVIPSGPALGSGLAQSLLHAGLFLLALAVWARLIDCRPFSNYGVSVTKSWIRAALAGFLAVLGGFTIWVGMSSVLGETSVQVVLATSDEPLLTWLVIPGVALLLHAAVQQIVFFRVILKNAAEGLHSRGGDARRSAIAALPVAVLFFIAMHGSVTPLRVLDLAFAGGIFALLYLHTGELAYGIGAHFGALYGGTLVFAVVQVTGSNPGILGVIDQYGFPKMIIAYLLVLAWLGRRQGEFPIHNAIAGGMPAD